MNSLAKRNKLPREKSITGSVYEHKHCRKIVIFLDISPTVYDVDWR